MEELKAKLEWEKKYSKMLEELLAHYQREINYLKANEAFYYPDIQDAYCYNDPKDEIPVVHNINTGLIYIPSEDYFHLDALDNALGNLLKNNINYFPAWIEQSAFAHMFYVDGRYKVLGAEKYRIPYFQNVDIKVNKKITINGLLSHQEDKHKCEIIHNRDKNAVQNMLNIVRSIFTIGRRPDIFTRIHT